MYIHSSRQESHTHNMYIHSSRQESHTHNMYIHSIHNQVSISRTMQVLKRLNRSSVSTVEVRFS